MRPGPLAGRYVAVATMVMLALIPFLALSAALGPLTPIIAAILHMSAQTMSLSSGLGNAAYALGTVLAVQFAQHLPQRRMLVVYASVLVAGSVLAASAQDAGMYIAGHILQGLATSMLLIAAVPPLAIGYPRERLRTTAIIMNMCIFGAVALGPFIGGVQAEAHAWRPLFWVVAAISASALVFSLLTFDDAPPANPDSPRDLPAIGLAAVGCVAAFFGVSELTSHRFLNAEVLAPLFGGLALIVILIVYQFRAAHPLLTIRALLTSAIPIAGIVVALFAAAAAVSATALTAGVLSQHYSPVRVGVLFLPELGGAIVSALAFGWVITRRSMHYLPLVGMLLLAAGIVVFRIGLPANQGLALVGSGLTGLALGATVAPALFVTGFSLPGGESATGVRHRRVAAGGGRIHDRADLRLLRCDRLGRQSQRRHRHRALDRPGSCARRRRSRRRHLRLQRRAGRPARCRSLLGRPGTRVVLAAAFRENQSKRAGRDARPRER